ncbi:MAG: hypothetical protein JSS64_05950 [Bacteroidetes bacterium]|nr:hypothetical protein [Bacteroidota bacterium]
MEQNFPSIQSAKNIVQQLQFEKTYSSVESAEAFFVIAKNLMLDINVWQSESTNHSVQFFITDNTEKVHHRNIHKGDLIRVKFLNSEMEKVDWMRINVLQYDDYPNENREVLTLHLSQVQDHPQKTNSYADLKKNRNEIYLSIERNHSHLISGLTICVNHEVHNSSNDFELPFKEHLSWDQLLQKFLQEE